MNKAMLVLAALLLAGCGSEEHRSVQWFADHEPERKAILQSCGRSAGIDSLECLNARKAESMALGSRRGYVQPDPVDID